MQGYMIQNMILFVVCGATIVGLYGFGAGGHSFWALTMLLCFSYEKSDKD